MPYLW